MPACCNCDSVFQYETNKVVQIHSVNYGTIKWLFHILVLSYVSFALVSDKLYQEKENVISSVHTKVKGIAVVTEEITENGVKKTLQRTLDTADYIFPMQANSFFVMTNFLKTEGQVQGLCPEYPTPRTVCSNDRGCKKGWMDPQSKGVQTGRCIQYSGNTKTCEVLAWCPIEAALEAPRPALLKSAENFTVLIKNNVDFPKHNYTTRNILPGFNITCTFHKTRNPKCPIFRLGDIFQETGDNFSDVAIQGGIMGIEIYWDCNLDKWFHHCRPKYSFRRLDDKTTNESLYPGYNFRYAKYYKESNVEKRTLIKVFGIRFDILVFGSGGKFDIIQLVVYIGSTLSYFGLATFFIDFIISAFSSQCCQSNIYPRCQRCKPCRVNEYYHRKKFETIMEPSRTLKYVSFEDEPFIRRVNQQLFGESLQYISGEKIPRPPVSFEDLSRLPGSCQEPPSVPAQDREMQLLSGEAPRSEDRPSWCQCGKCLPSQLSVKTSRWLEELCCRKTPGKCITTTSPFQRLILSRVSLQFRLLCQTPLLELDTESNNSQLRHLAYRSYTTWRFSSVEMADFAILPSCCRWTIRREFPRSQGQYSGFKSPF
ncbi:P2X purinoceptor 7 [Rhynchocyon petersi]